LPGDERNARVLLDYLIAETGRQHTLESFRQQARDLVIQHRRTIERAAKLLMEAGGMSGCRVSAIVKRGGEPPPSTVSIADILLDIMEEQEVADEQTARRKRVLTRLRLRPTSRVRLRQSGVGLREFRPPTPDCRVPKPDTSASTLRTQAGLVYFPAQKSGL
jgi:hypothetical protein